MKEYITKKNVLLGSYHLGAWGSEVDKAVIVMATDSGCVDMWMIK